MRLFRTGGNTERLNRITADGRGLSQFTAKAWGERKIKYWNSKLLTDSHNVSSSISDNGAVD